MISINFNKHSWIIALLLLSVAIGGCKNQQKIAEQEAARVEAENIARAKEILTNILSDDGKMALAEKERLLAQVKSMNLDNPEVMRLISQVEDMLDREREAEKTVQETPPPRPDAADQLSDLFDEIAGAPSIEAANAVIEETLDMFSSPDALVLIIISKSGDLKDYDQPTNIGQYLHYLKDQKTSANAVYDVVNDGNGKINELELIKKSIR